MLRYARNVSQKIRTFRTRHFGLGEKQDVQIAILRKDVNTIIADGIQIRTSNVETQSNHPISLSLYCTSNRLITNNLETTESETNRIRN